MPFVKLDCKILYSSIWAEDSDTCKVWITILAMADSNGLVSATAPGIARIACVSLEATERALTRFEGPDKWSKSQDGDGRRIERIDGGYMILNYEYYREKDHGSIQRSKRYREKMKTLRDVTRDATSRNVSSESVSVSYSDIPPTLEEVKKYIQERGYSIDADAWFDFYQSKGWMIGKNKMKDWRAAVRTWTRGDSKRLPMGHRQADVGKNPVESKPLTLDEKIAQYEQYERDGQLDGPAQALLDRWRCERLETETPGGWQP